MQKPGLKESNIGSLDTQCSAGMQVSLVDILATVIFICNNTHLIQKMMHCAQRVIILVLVWLQDNIDFVANSDLPMLVGVNCSQPCQSPEINEGN